MDRKYKTNAERQKAYRARHRNAKPTNVTQIAAEEFTVTTPPKKGCQRCYYWTVGGKKEILAVVVSDNLCPPKSGCAVCALYREKQQ